MDDQELRMILINIAESNNNIAALMQELLEELKEQPLEEVPAKQEVPTRPSTAPGTRRIPPPAPQQEEEEEETYEEEELPAAPRPPIARVKRKEL